MPIEKRKPNPDRMVSHERMFVKTIRHVAVVTISTLINNKVAEAMLELVQSLPSTWRIALGVSAMVAAATIAAFLWVPQLGAWVQYGAAIILLCFSTLCFAGPWAPKTKRQPAHADEKGESHSHTGLILALIGTSALAFVATGLALGVIQAPTSDTTSPSPLLPPTPAAATDAPSQSPSPPPSPSPSPVLPCSFTDPTGPVTIEYRLHTDISCPYGASDATVILVDPPYPGLRSAIYRIYPENDAGSGRYVSDLIIGTTASTDDGWAFEVCLVTSGDDSWQDVQDYLNQTDRSGIAIRPEVAKSWSCIPVTHEPSTIPPSQPSTPAPDEK